jgi:uncharacterized RDD family membrane protein YckC
MNNQTPDFYSSTSDYLNIQSPEGLDYQLEIAGMGARSHAFTIDWQIRLLLALTWLLAVGLSIYSLDEMLLLLKQPHATTPTLILLVPAGVVYFFYHPVLEIAMCGRTPGKRMAGVRLVTLQGYSPKVGAILLRNVFRLIDSLPGFYFLGLLSVALTRNHVRIGDLASGLVLVYDPTVKPKTLQHITDLAVHSDLSLEDQVLLVDLLSRWPELSAESRIRLAQQFLARIGKHVDFLRGIKKPELVLKNTLENLLPRFGDTDGN